MRVLFVNHTSIVSGAEHSLLTLIDGLPRQMVAGLACPPGPLASMARELGVDVYLVRGTAGSMRVHPWRTAVAATELARTGVALARVVDRANVSILHANSMRACVAAVISCRLRRRGLVAHVRDCLPDSRIARSIHRFVAREADEVVAISEYVAERFRTGLSGPGPVIHVIDDPIDLRRFRPGVPGSAAISLRGAPLLAIVGQISPWKGQDTAILALSEIHHEYPDAHLLIVGEVKFDTSATRFDNRGYAAGLHRLVKDLGLVDAVEFVGERDDVPEIMSSADVVLVPSVEEPFGRTVAEAMAVGTPVVATDVGGPAEVVEDGTTGLLAPPGDPVVWSEAIRRILKHPDVASEMSRRATDVARRRFATERHVAAMMSVYESAERLSWLNER